VVILRTPLQRKTYALLVPLVLSASLGNVLLGKGMKQVAEVRAWPASPLAEISLNVLANRWIWLGISSLLLFLVLFMLVLSWADYSFVVPASSASYAMAVLMSHWLLKEAVTPERWAGVALICLGVALIARTPSSSKTGSQVRE
jgi:drug/metabolite transporter (DMT)-like permease